jgi:hypothetical protein
MHAAQTMTHIASTHTVSCLAQRCQLSKRIMISTSVRMPRGYALTFGCAAPSPCNMPGHWFELSVNAVKARARATRSAPHASVKRSQLAALLNVCSMRHQ